MERHVVGVRSAYVAIQLEFELPINHHFIVKKMLNLTPHLTCHHGLVIRWLWTYVVLLDFVSKNCPLNKITSVT